MSSPVAATHTHMKRALRGRRVLLVDIENVAGGAIRTPAMAMWARRVIDDALGGVEGDHVIVGTCHWGLVDIARAWPTARLLVRSGHDGADLELLEVLTTENLGLRFDEVVIVSGDGIFAKAVAGLEEAGVPVTVAAWSEVLSTRLALAASRAVALEDGLNGHRGEAA